MEIDKIKIGGILYKVERVKDLENPTDHRKLDGHILYAECKILIDDRLPQQSFMQTLWHEVIHGIFINSGRPEVKEDLIDALAYGLMQVLYDNPQLADVRQK